MSNFELEQTTELETLGYIFPDELQIIDQGPPANFSISVTIQDQDLLDQIMAEAKLKDPDDFDINAFEQPSFVMLFTYTPQYPDELPEVTIEDVVAIDQEDIDLMLPHVLQTASSDSMGMAMVFSIVSSGREFIEQRIADGIAAERLDRQRRIEEEEEAERERYRGTRVTTESFDTWKRSFLKEARVLYKAGEKLSVSLEAALIIYDGVMRNASNKPTGKQLFEKDRTLAMSDTQYLDESDVAVDVELFEGIEELDLDSDEDDNQVLAHFNEDD